MPAHPPSSPIAPLLAPMTLPRGMRRDALALVEKVAGGPRTADLLFTLPHAALDRGACVPIAEAREGDLATILAEVDAHMPAHNARSPYRVRLRDETGFLSVAYFRPRGDMLARLYPVGAKRIVSGKVELYNGERQMLHPDHVVDPSGGDAPPSVEPVYPLTAGLPLRTLQRAIGGALAVLPELPEWLDPTTPAGHGWPSFAQALRSVHLPQTVEDVLPPSKARTRLAYDEWFARQCALRLRRAHRQDSPGRAAVGDGRLVSKILEAAPYAPTGAQARALKEIQRDMARPSPMLRLLQGDVGSGKTLVAALSMATAAEAGLQSALMAPTDLLARQHGAGLTPLLEAAGLRVIVLTGKDKPRDRARAAELLATGAAHVVIGTHALFQEHIAFRDLGLIVIDEQHRFGVSDRRRLVEKGEAPHVLVMSATPIPRTLALAVHGDMDLSVLDEKPPGRKPIRTAAMPTSRMDEVVEAIAGAAERGERAYWVCPLIEESEAIDLAAAQDRFEALKERFGEGVELVHGRMSASVREATMDRFRSGQSFLLVATTVIEVGVDVPEATIMVIEHAERFGLAQLHQLRGRVGRGGRAGYCVLLWRPPLSEGAKERLDALRRSDDGFVIAETDYRMRGSGDVLGVQQSGMPPFRLVDAEAHGDLLGAADKEARLAIDRDPTLETPRGRAIAMLLELFGYDEAAALARSG